MIAPSPPHSPPTPIGAGMLLAAVALAPQATTQTQELGIYPAATQFTARSALPITSDGDVLVHFRRNLLVGAGNPGITVQGLRAILQDQDLSSEDPFEIVVLANDGSGMPDTAPGNELLRATNLTLPTGTGLGAAVVSTAFATPLTVPDDDYFVGIGIGTAPLWPLDGVSIHGCNYAGPANVDDPTVPGLVTTHDATLDRLVGGQRRLHAIHLLTDGVALLTGADVDPASRRGAPNPNFGIRGAYQDRLARDGLAVRVSDATLPNAGVVVLGQLGGATLPYRIPGLDGRLFLNPTLVFPDLVTMGTTDSRGSFETIALAWPLQLPAPFELISMQAIVDPLGVARLSNLAVVRD